ncbi:MFS transporter [Mycetocola tolaasinivorans]|nr:MFS transporter [Mycetocola tolaasinivorans]
MRTPERPDPAGAAATVVREHTAWASILLLMLTSFMLVVAEFLPPSLLPAMSAALGITEGQAGQAVTATALAGFVAGPTVGILFPRLDRRTLLVLLAVAAALSSALVALSASYVMLLVARLLLGAALGAFWAMSIAIAARLSAPHRLGRAIMIVNTGPTAATVAGVPVGTYLGSVMDWRLIFAAVAVLTVLVGFALRAVLPQISPAPSGGGFRSLGETLRIPGIRQGLTGHMLTVLGHFIAFTYILLVIARVPGLDAAAIALLLVVFGVGGVVGNLVIGLLVDRHLAVLRFVVPALIGTSIALLAALPGQHWVVITAMTTWGIGFGAWLTTLSTWMGRVVPDRMESGGGLVVAGFQLAIAVGAGIGGLLIDGLGVVPALTIAAASALAGGVVFGTARTTR